MSNLFVDPFSYKRCRLRPHNHKVNIKQSLKKQLTHFLLTQEKVTKKDVKFPNTLRDYY